MSVNNKLMNNGKFDYKCLEELHFRVEPSDSVLYRNFTQCHQRIKFMKH